MVILNFHGVGPVTRDVDDGERDCWIDNDFLGQILERVKREDQEHVRLTVDDGNESDYTYILPALKTRGLSATFFLCANKLDQKTYLTKAQVSELLSEGMTIGNHGMDHTPWINRPAKKLEYEICDSTKILEDTFQVPVNTAACPFGKYDWSSLRLLKRNAYNKVYTSDCGTCNQDQWLTPRNTIRQSMSESTIDKIVKSKFSASSRIIRNVKMIMKRSRGRVFSK